MRDGQQLLIGQDAPTAATPWIQTPGFLADRALRLHQGLLALNTIFSELAAQKRFATDSAKWREWKSLLERWGKWYGQTSGTSWLWSATDATLEEYEKSLQTWTAWARRAFPETAAQLPTPPPIYTPDGKARGEGIPVWLVVVLAGAGAYAAFKILR